MRTVTGHIHKLRSGILNHVAAKDLGSYPGMWRVGGLWQWGQLALDQAGRHNLSGRQCCHVLEGLVFGGLVLGTEYT